MFEAINYAQGHKIVWIEKRQRWVYCNNRSPVILGKRRACVRCHKTPLPYKASTGYGVDACLGLIPGLWALCCGHGMCEGYAAIKKGPSTWDVVLPMDSTPEQRRSIINQFLNQIGPGESAKGVIN